MFDKYTALLNRKAGLSDKFFDGFDELPAVFFLLELADPVDFAESFYGGRPYGREQPQHFVAQYDVGRKSLGVGQLAPQGP